MTPVEPRPGLRPWHQPDPRIAGKDGWETLANLRKAREPDPIEFVFTDAPAPAVPVSAAKVTPYSIGVILGIVVAAPILLYVGLLAVAMLLLFGFAYVITEFLG